MLIVRLKKHKMESLKSMPEIELWKRVRPVLMSCAMPLVYMFGNNAYRIKSPVLQRMLGDVASTELLNSGDLLLYILLTIPFIIGFLTLYLRSPWALYAARGILVIVGAPLIPLVINYFNPVRDTVIASTLLTIERVYSNSFLFDVAVEKLFNSGVDIIRHNSIIWNKVSECRGSLDVLLAAGIKNILEAIRIAELPILRPIPALPKLSTWEKVLSSKWFDIVVASTITSLIGVGVNRALSPSAPALPKSIDADIRRLQSDLSALEDMVDGVACADVSNKVDSLELAHTAIISRVTELESNASK